MASKVENRTALAFPDLRIDKLAVLFGFISGTLPFYTKDKYRCANCNTEFDVK